MVVCVFEDDSFIDSLENDQYKQTLLVTIIMLHLKQASLTSSKQIEIAKRKAHDVGLLVQRRPHNLS